MKMMNDNNQQWPSIPRVRPGVFIYQAPAPVMVTVNDRQALLDLDDTLTIIPEENASDITILFDWDVEAGSLQHRYDTNTHLGGEVDIWYDRR